MIPGPTSQTPEHPSGQEPQRALTTMLGFLSCFACHLTHPELLLRKGSGDRVSWESSPPYCFGQESLQVRVEGRWVLQVLLCSRPFRWVTQSPCTPSWWMRLPSTCVLLWATFWGWFIKSKLPSQPRWAGQLGSPNWAPTAGCCLRDLQWMTSWLGSASASSG